MANITEQHLHHMAKRHHVTMRKYDAIKEKLKGVTERALSTLEVGSGAFLGGVLEGRTDGYAPLHVPLNLLVGGALQVVAHLDLAGDPLSSHLSNVGNGFIAAYIGGVGHNFGSRWRETGKFLPAKGEGGTHVKGEVSQAQMDQIIQRMGQAAAGQPVG